MPATVTSRRRQLGNEIRRARRAAGLTQAEVGELLGCGQGKINKIESGSVSVKLGDLEQMLVAFKASPAEKELMLELARNSPQRGQWSGYRSAVPQWFRTFADLEPAAAEICGWHGERMPGPLQSEHYMLKQFTEAQVTDVTALVRNRLERKKVFDSPKPPYYRFILGEAALRRMPGGASPVVALDQVQHLIALDKKYPRVFINVLPFDAKLPYVPNDFTIMRFSDNTKDFVFVEHAAGGLNIEDDRDFELFLDAWDQLRDGAMRKNETVDFLHMLADEYRAKLAM